ncbi:hypothetical protein MKW94_027263 [Papaver nudicaule]|uniref:Pre-rRNA-processing protein TSR2 homolog n=1 Tax=Papaver nudicaule TaxID=74823 RepID=A0AA42B2Z3_PAPNU|nr:hypothetical protein [Papaver nudicaule]MCL7049513.1 hypothetical protein [Papaver nudicaule]
MFSGCEDGKKMTRECRALIEEGIYLILLNWTGLKLALEHRSYDRFSCQTAEQLRLDIFSWFTQSKDLDIEDLKEILDDCMDKSFDTDFADGSIEKVASHLMIMHEECLQGKHESIEKLRTLDGGAEAVSRSKMVVDDEELFFENDAEELVSYYSTNMLVDDSNENKTVEVEEGWSVVAAKKSKGRRSRSSKKMSS